MPKGKRYDRDFQLNAARLVVEQGYTVAEVSRKLGVSDWSVSRWIARFRELGELKVDGSAVAEAGDEICRTHVFIEIGPMNALPLSEIPCSRMTPFRRLTFAWCWPTMRIDASGDI